MPTVLSTLKVGIEWYQSVPVSENLRYRDIALRRSRDGVRGTPTADVVTIRLASQCARDCRDVTVHRVSQQIRCIGIRRRYPDGVTGKVDKWADDDGDDTDFWSALPGFRESLIEAEADYGAGRTFSEGHIRAHCGLPQRDADQQELRPRCTAHGKWMSEHPDAVAAADEWADGNLDGLNHT